MSHEYYKLQVVLNIMDGGKVLLPPLVCFAAHFADKNNITLLTR